jgi:hypothetical protein
MVFFHQATHNDLLKEKIYLVFYHEMNQGKSLEEDFGVLV